MCRLNGFLAKISTKKQVFQKKGKEGISTFFVIWQQITGEHWKIEVSVLFGVFSLTLLFFANRKLISCHFHSCFAWKFSELLISLWWFLPKFLIFVEFISEEMSYISFEKKNKGKKTCVQKTASHQSQISQLWKSILHQRKVDISPFQFYRRNIRRDNSTLNIIGPNYICYRWRYRKYQKWAEGAIHMVLVLLFKNFLCQMQIMQTICALAILQYIGALLGSIWKEKDGYSYSISRTYKISNHFENIEQY